MILMLDKTASDLKRNIYRFIIVYYDQEEKDLVKTLPKLEEIEDKYAFTITYIDFESIKKKWKKAGLRIALDAEDIPEVFGVFSIKRKDERRQDDYNRYVLEVRTK